MHGRGHRQWLLAHPPPDPRDGAIRYRLLLRENPVDAGEAFRCYGRCQAQATPRAYLDCLETCPGFEVTPREYCANTEVPPVAACFTARKVPVRAKLDPSLVVLAVLGSFLLVIGAESLCASSPDQCGFSGRYPSPR